MRKQKLIINVLSIVFVLQLVLMFASCASSGVSSENKGEYKEMKRYHSKKEYLAALEIATKLIALEPEAQGPKKFIFKNFNRDMQVVMQELSNQPQTSKQAEKQYKMYSHLVNIYGHLSTINLPITDKKGKKSFTTEIKDFKPQKEAARKLAYKLITDDANNYVAELKYAEAKASFKNAIENYLLTDQEKIEARKSVVSLLLKKAKELSLSKDVQNVIGAYHFYKTVLSFDHENQLAVTGAANMKKAIAVLYIAEGAAYERSKDVAAWEKAVVSYKRAFYWDKENMSAKDKEKKCVLRITVFYYNTANRAEKSKESTKAIENYRLALSWTTDYKDAMYRMYNLRISCQLDSCSKYAKISKKNCTPMFEQARKIKTSVDKSYNAISGIQKMVGSVESLEGNLEQLSSAIQPLGYVPFVGPVCKTVKYNVDRIHTKAERFSSKLSVMNTPVLIPLEKLLSSAKTQLAHNDVNNKQYKEALIQLAGMRKKLQPMLKNCGNNEKKYKEVETYVKDAFLALKGMGDVSVKATKNLIALYRVSNVIDNYEKYINPAASAVNKVESVLNKMKPTLKSINNILNKKIGYKSVSFSARKILNGIGGMTPDFIKKGLKKLAKKALNPALKKMGVRIPDIPYVNEATRLLDQSKLYYSKLSKSITNWTKCNKDYEQDCKKLTTTINRLNSVNI